MVTDEFEWDDKKAAINLGKHGISFERATFAFDDPDGIDFIDESGLGEEVRFKLVARAEHSLLAVIYTERPPRIRIISAREADADEQERYWTRRGPG